LETTFLSRNSATLAQLVKQAHLRTIIHLQQEAKIFSADRNDYLLSLSSGT